MKAGRKQRKITMHTNPSTIENNSGVQHEDALYNKVEHAKHETCGTYVYAHNLRVHVDTETPTLRG